MVWRKRHVQEPYTQGNVFVIVRKSSRCKSLQVAASRMQVNFVGKGGELYPRAVRRVSEVECTPIRCCAAWSKSASCILNDCYCTPSDLECNLGESEAYKSIARRAQTPELRLLSNRSSSSLRSHRIALSCSCRGRLTMHRMSIRRGGGWRKLRGCRPCDGVSLTCSPIEGSQTRCSGT
jgi:hypothetical protein